MLSRSEAELVGERLDHFIGVRAGVVEAAWNDLIETGTGAAEWPLQRGDGRGPVLMRLSGISRVAPDRHLVLVTDLAAHLRLELELRTQAELGRLAIDGTPVAELMQIAADRISEVLALDLVSVSQLEPYGDYLTHDATVGWPVDPEGEERLPSGQSHSGYAMRQSEPVIVRDFELEQRFKPAQSLLDQGARSGIACKIMGDGAAYGVISAHSLAVRDFGPGDGEFLEAVASVLGAALARERADELELRLEQGRRLELIGELAGGVSHDFRNLLTIVINAAEFIRTSVESDEPIDPTMIDAVQDSARGGVSLTSQLLAVGGPAEPGQPTTATIERCISMLSGSLPAGITLAATVEADLPDVVGGSGAIEQILINLILNARDAMPDGGTVSATASLAKAPGARSGVRITVSDDGAGMDAETRARIFERFFTTKDTHSGTGMGLAVVRRLVDEAVGEVEVASTPGQGTRFTVTLPSPPAAAGRGGMPKGHGEQILLVADESARTLTRLILETGGFRVTACATAAEALELSDQALADIDLVLTEVVPFGGTSGIELIAALEARRPGLPALFLSGLSRARLEGVGLDPDDARIVSDSAGTAHLLTLLSDRIGDAPAAPG